MHYCYPVSAADLAVSVLGFTLSVVVLTVSCQHYSALLEQQTRSIIPLRLLHHIVYPLPSHLCPTLYSTVL